MLYIYTVYSTDIYVYTVYMVLSCLADFISSISDQRGLQYTVYICLYIVVNTGGSTVGEKLGVKVNIGTTILSCIQ